MKCVECVVKENISFFPIFLLFLLCCVDVHFIIIIINIGVNIIVIVVFIYLTTHSTHFLCFLLFCFGFFGGVCLFVCLFCCCCFVLGFFNKYFH